MTKTENIKGILTKRYNNPQTYWQIVYEWEDVFAEMLNIPLIGSKDAIKGKLANFFVRNWYLLIDKLCKFFSKKRTKKGNDYFLFFQMNINNVLYFSPAKKRKLIPYIIDCFFTERDLPAIYEKYRYCPLILISSQEAFEFLKSRNCPLNIQLLPLSLADKYQSRDIYKKRYDIIAPGRANPIFEKFMQQYLSENPTVEYISCKKIDNNNNDNVYEYHSNLKGRLDLDFSSRENYIQFLKDGKVTFYSTPGISDPKKTGGFNPVTPRYLEMLAFQNQILMLYPDTIETQSFEMNKVCENLDTYDKFKQRLDFYLSSNVDINLYKQILSRHYTSQRVEEFCRIIKNNL